LWGRDERRGAEEKKIHIIFLVLSFLLPTITNRRRHHDAKVLFVALIGSSGGGTATLGHTDPIELLETVNKELLNIHDKNDTRICKGISHAIFVCLDGGGFDAVRNEKDWVPDDNIQGDNLGPPAALYPIQLALITSYQTTTMHQHQHQ